MIDFTILELSNSGSGECASIVGEGATADILKVGYGVAYYILIAAVLGKPEKLI